MAVSRIQVLNGYWSEISISFSFFFFFLPCEPLNRFTYNVASLFLQSESSEREKERARKTEATNFCSLISEATSQHIFLLLRSKSLGHSRREVYIGHELRRGIIGGHTRGCSPQGNNTAQNNRIIIAHGGGGW